MIDAIQQRIVGVLIEKELTVPDAYPLTENNILLGCNQKSNRDPVMSVSAAEIHPALLFLREDGWIVRVDSGGRSARYRHKVMERLNIDKPQMIVMSELLVRGPQAPGALKPRVARMGHHADPAQIEDVLRSLAAHAPVPLVERLARLPRERDHRWGHLLGPRPQPDVVDEPESEVRSPARERTPAPVVDPGLRERVEHLEDDVAELRRIVESLRGLMG